MTGEDTSPTLICRLRVYLPKDAWVRNFSRDHPDLAIEVLNHLPSSAGDTTVELRVQGVSAGTFDDVIAKYHGVKRVELVASRGTEAEYRVIHATVSLLSDIGKLHLMPRLPFLIKGGEATWVVVATRARIEELYARLQKVTSGAVIESLRESEKLDRLDMLTERQREIFTRAMSEGYFEVPRRISLTDLAHAMSLSKSTLSESLAIIERKMLNEMLEYPTRPFRGA